MDIPLGTSGEPMHIQVLSDLHLEVSKPAVGGGYTTFEYDFPARADILALLGDIGTTNDDRFFDWLRAQLKRFKLVFFLSGNHEAYRSSIKDATSRLAAFAKEMEKQANSSTPDVNYGRFVLLDRTRYDLSDTVTVLGCTLWSHLDSKHVELIHLGLNDFHMIKDFTPDVYQSLHKRDAEWLSRTVTDIAHDEPHRKLIVMTHHAPTVDDTSNPMYRGGQMGSAFSTELSQTEWWPHIKVWMFGHTHWPCDFERNGVRVLSNPKGYRTAGDDGYDPEMVVEV
ncbi:Ser/Thr protein phosphatase protein [Lentinus tigrinus ALCF2SS1-7]|uniref:Ser/Thr protein phosphatase protein n=1 Tax=Lentinus tigrinus ALCF2SS1-7 TaxID=1328758 RepID=UPI0011663D3B|nr:Ser/Thr protein phosphatase protein [Lentinus tigrinus ALCF2SS1-7]